jgi:hypothetical protein
MMPNNEPAPKSKEMRYFLCTGECVRYADLPKYPDSHIIGHLTFVSDEGKQVTALARWEVSESCSKVPHVMHKIDCLIIGDVRSIKCRYPSCDNKQRWEIGKAAFLALMNRYGKEVVSETDMKNAKEDRLIAKGGP